VVMQDLICDFDLAEFAMFRFLHCVHLKCVSPWQTGGEHFYSPQ